MRYYNENPQVTVWREKCEQYEKLVKGTEKVRNFNVELLEKRLKGYNEDYNLLLKENKGLKKDIERLVNEIEKFNELPWWKKIFFQFGM